MRIAISLIFITMFSFTSHRSFKESQKEYVRVREAYEEKEADIADLLTKHHIESDALRLYIRSFKQEELLELWAKNEGDNSYQLIKTYDICRNSGVLGPKRKQGDLQVPEGFYHINRFNPTSNYHLSLGINYPNRSDKILGYKKRLGGDIFIHGNCVTIGCLPMTDDKIKEIYILCVEAKNSGQKTIPVTLFPAKLSMDKMEELSVEYADNPEVISLWKSLKTAYDLFDKTKKLPSISFLSDGQHNVRE